MIASLVLGVVCAITLFCIAAWSQIPKPGPEVKASEPAPRSQLFAPEMTAADVGAFLDGLLPQQLQGEDIAGAVVVIVKNRSSKGCRIHQNRTGARIRFPIAVRDVNGRSSDLPKFLS